VYVRPWDPFVDDFTGPALPSDLFDCSDLESFDRADWNGADSLVVDRMGYVLGVLATSATAAVGKFERFQTVFVDTRPAPAGETWDYDKGTSPGKGDEPAMSEQDAEIVRRIRARCPDNRYERGSDAELTELFRRNKRVLSRSDEDVIAAMTHSRQAERLTFRPSCVRRPQTTKLGFFKKGRGSPDQAPTGSPTRSR
jgi:hypothetical protein